MRILAASEPEAWIDVACRGILSVLLEPTHDSSNRLPPLPDQTANRHPQFGIAVYFDTLDREHFLSLFRQIVDQTARSPAISTRVDHFLDWFAAAR